MREVVSVDSTVIEVIEYDSSTETLTVKFKNGSVYEYYGITKKMFEDFAVSPSKGRFFHRNIRGVYPCKKRNN